VVNRLLTEAQVEDRLRRDLNELADDVADLDDALWTSATSLGLRAAPDRRSRRSLPLVASAAAVVVLGIAIGVAMSQHPESVATRSDEPASAPLATTLAPEVVRRRGPARGRRRAPSALPDRRRRRGDGLALGRTAGWQASARAHRCEQRLLRASAR
jgi:hypothetical protein